MEGRALVFATLGMIAALIGPPAGAQVTAVKLEPIDEWAIERDGDLCTATRSFGNPAAPTRVQLRNRDPWNGGFHVAIMSEGFALEGDTFSAGWLPGGRFVSRSKHTDEAAQDAQPTLVFEHGLWDGNMPEDGTPEHEAYWERVEPDTFRGPRDFKRNVDGLLVNGAFNRALLFATGPMDGVIDARDRCIDEVLTARGIDPADEDRDDHIVELLNSTALARHIFRNLPPSMRRAGWDQIVSFLVYLDADTQVTGCYLLGLPRDAGYEQFGCEALRERARFRFKAGEASRAAFYKFAGRLTP